MHITPFISGFQQGAVLKRTPRFGEGPSKPGDKPFTIDRTPRPKPDPYWVLGQDFGEGVTGDAVFRFIAHCWQKEQTAKEKAKQAKADYYQVLEAYEAKSFFRRLFSRKPTPPILEPRPQPVSVSAVLKHFDADPQRLFANHREPKVQGAYQAMVQLNEAGLIQSLVLETVPPQMWLFMLMDATRIFPTELGRQVAKSQPPSFA